MAPPRRVSYTPRAMFTLVRRLLRLAWPVTLARLGIMGMGVCDAMVVGRLAPGEVAPQAPRWGAVVRVLVARALGANHPEQAGGALQRGLVVSIVGGGAASLLVYVECEHVLR